MSKIIYRKIRTAPGVKQYLDEQKTLVNPQFEASASYHAQSVALETMSLRDMAKHITSHGTGSRTDLCQLHDTKGTLGGESGIEADETTGRRDTGMKVAGNVLVEVLCLEFLGRIEIGYLLTAL